MTSRKLTKNLIGVLLLAGLTAACGSDRSGDEPVAEFTSTDSDSVAPLASSVPAPSAPVSSFEDQDSFEDDGAAAENAPLPTKNLLMARWFSKRSFTPGWGVSNDHYLQIQSLVDDLEIQEISINRGNCDVWAGLPITLDYGQQHDFQKAECNVLDVSIETNQGPIFIQGSMN